MVITFIIEPVGIEGLDVEWNDELPIPGDHISIMYYLDDEKCNEFYKQIIQESPVLSELERSHLGKSMGYLLDTYFTVVKSRIWTGKGYGLMLNCELS